MKKIFLYSILASIMGALYYLIEVLYDGTSHFSMAILGAIIGMLIGLLNEYGLKWETPLWKQLLIGECIILPLEFFTGYLLHFVLDIQPPVWDYSELPLNLLGQTSLFFAPVFLPCILLAILIDDYYRYFFMSEEKPRYKIF